MGDNWGFVAAAYGLAVIVLGAYWRRLVRREREVGALLGSRRADPGGGRSPSHPSPSNPRSS